MSLASREVRRRFWRSISEGLNPPRAAAAAGVSTRTGWWWFYQAGGMPSLSLASPTSSRRLSLQDREQIQAGLSAGCSFRAIARALGRAPSTITGRRGRTGRWRRDRLRSRRVGAARPAGRCRSG